MQVTPAGLASDGTVLGIATVAWIAGTAFILDHITASLYDAALALVKAAATASGG